MNKSTRKKKGSPALILSRSASDWLSCSVITANLKKAYELAWGSDASLYAYNPNEDVMSFWVLARKIFQARPDRIIFLDHSPSIHALVRAILAQYQTAFPPPIYFHVYGDFTLYSALWLETGRLLENKEVKWICASEKQARLVSKFISNPLEEIRVCPFPVDTNEYFFNSNERKNTRLKLGINEGEMAVLYAGRLSLQKNCVTLLRELELFHKMTRVPLRFFLAGTIDDLGAPFFGINPKRGAFFQRWKRALNRLSPEFQKRVSYRGHLSGSDLRKHYVSADVYVSLSLHHDEDFGMSPAEALCCGTPSILSDWGGFSSMTVKPKLDKNLSCQLIPTKIGRSGLSLSTQALQRALLNISENSRGKGETPQTSLKRSEVFSRHFSISSVSQLLQSLHQEKCEEFGGFNDRMRILDRFKREGLVFPKGPVSQSFYEEIYGAYVSE